jgi:protein TonB
MSEIAIDRGSLLPDPFTEWYRGRPFQVAFAVSVIIHALLILLLPELRSVQIEPPQVLNVELLTAEPEAVPEPQPIIRQPEPVREPVVESPPPIERQVVRPEPVIEPPPPVERQVPRPEPVIQPPPVQQVQPEAPPPARAELTPPIPREIPREQPMVRNRPEPQPEHTLEIPQQKVMPQAPPDMVPPPPPVRAEPRPVPQAPPRIEPEIQRVPPPVSEVPPPISASRPVPPVARVEPSPAPEVIAPAPITERPVIQPPAPPVTAQPAPPVERPAAPVAPRRAEASRELTMAYSQLLSSQIKRHQKYPLVAQRRKWEGTAEVLLKVSPDGRVTNIALARSTGREILDKEALEMVKRATPLPQAPQALRGQELTVTVPIVFRLQDS